MPHFPKTQSQSADDYPADIIELKDAIFLFDWQERILACGFLCQILNKGRRSIAQCICFYHLIVDWFELF